MKKRRELDALVNGKSGRRKKKGQHELLRNDTDSSEVEEFAIPPKTIVRKRGGITRICSTCIAVCGFFLLAACVVAVGGLVWVHVELKKEVDNLTMELEKVKNGNDLSTTDNADLRNDQTQLKTKVGLLETTMNEHVQGLADVKAQLDGLQKSTDDLTQSIESASVIQNLPDLVKGLSTQVATMGSDVSGMKQDLTTLMQDHSVLEELSEIQDRLTALESQTTPSSVLVTPPVESGPQVTQLSQALMSLNSSLVTQIGLLQAHSDQHLVEIESIRNMTNQLNHRVSILELHPSTEAMEASNMESLVQHAVEQAMQNIPSGPDTTNLETMQVQVNNISANVQTLTSETYNNKDSFLQELNDISARLSTQGDDFIQKISAVTKSSSSLQQRVSALESQVQYMDSRLPSNSDEVVTPPATEAPSAADSEHPREPQDAADPIEVMPGNLNTPSTNAPVPLAAADDNPALKNPNVHASEAGNLGSESSTIPPVEVATPSSFPETAPLVLPGDYEYASGVEGWPDNSYVGLDEDTEDANDGMDDPDQPDKRR